MAEATLDRITDQRFLIDARLDSIDRMLMDSGVHRSERAEIIQSVEDQIAEMLVTQEGDTERDRVLMVLRSLDPPEAFGSSSAVTPARRRVGPAPQAATPIVSAVPVQRARTSGAAITSLVLALLSIPTIIILPLGGLISMIAAIFGVIAISSVAGSQGALRGGWMGVFACVMFGLHFFALFAVLMIQ